MHSNNYIEMVNSLKLAEEKPYIASSTLKQWAEEDRPREKLLLKGRSSLSEAELLAILINSGSREKTAVELSRDILAGSQNDLMELGLLSVEELMKYKGIGEAKAITIIAALELGRRRETHQATERKYIRLSSDAYRCLKAEMADLDHEEFWVLYLRQNNSIIRKEMLSSGGLTGTIADSRLMLKRAIDLKAASVVLAHNHPSGGLKPSQSDIMLTKRMKEGCDILNIKMMDHIIISSEGFYSFSDKGQLKYL